MATDENGMVTADFYVPAVGNKADGYVPILSVTANGDGTEYYMVREYMPSEFNTADGAELTDDEYVYDETVYYLKLTVSRSSVVGENDALVPTFEYRTDLSAAWEALSGGITFTNTYITPQQPKPAPGPPTTPSAETQRPTGTAPPQPGVVITVPPAVTTSESPKESNVGQTPAPLEPLTPVVAKDPAVSASVEPAQNADEMTIPPVPAANVIMISDTEYLELDEDGTPLGTWYWNGDEWVFVPIAKENPKTGDSGGEIGEKTAGYPAIVLAFVSGLAIGGGIAYLNGRRRKNAKTAL